MIRLPKMSKKEKLTLAEDAYREYQMRLHVPSGLPIAYGWRANDLQIEIICPICGQRHLHSLPSEKYSPRVRHCQYGTGNMDGYALVLLPGEMPEEVRQACELWRRANRDRWRRERE